VCAAVALAGVIAACGSPPTATAERAELPEVAITVNALGTAVATIVVTATASDIATPLVFNFTVQNGVATGALKLSPGRARTITARAFESDGALASEGTVIIDVERGANPAISIPMVSRAGQVPVTVTLGPVSIAIVPATASVAVGATLQLAATIRAADGQVLQGPPEWATTDPTVVTVSATGLVTALRAGRAEVVATYAGVAARSIVSVEASAGGAATIDAVDLASTQVPLGGSVPYTATITNPTGGVLRGLVVQGWVRQGAARRAAGGAVLMGCGPALGDLAPGTCRVQWSLVPSNSNSGTGTLVAGSATAEVELRTDLAVVSTFTLPITLVGAPAARGSGIIVWGNTMMKFTGSAAFRAQIGDAGGDTDDYVLLRNMLQHLSGKASGVRVLYTDPCDPRTDPEVCHIGGLPYLRPFYDAVGSVGTLAYGDLASAELASYDVVIADFCGLPPADHGLLRAYLSSGGPAIVLADNFCTNGSATTATLANTVVGDLGVTFTDEVSSAERLQIPVADRVGLLAGVSNLSLWRFTRVQPIRDFAPVAAWNGNVLYAIDEGPFPSALATSP
jgi:Tfp pilus assembly major pilin PilA